MDLPKNINANLEIKEVIQIDFKGFQDLEGIRICEKYLIGRMLSQGSQGKIYKCIDLDN